MKTHRIQKALFALLATSLALACSTAQVWGEETPTPAPAPSSTSTATPAPTATQTAIPTLDWTPVPCENNDCLDACMARVETVLASSPFQDIENEYYDNASTFDLVAYPVDGNTIGDMEALWVPADYKIYQADESAHHRIWNYFKAVIPPSMRKRVNRLVIFTDGSLNKLAWVKPSGEGSEYWTIGFDIVDSDYPPYLTETLIHEVGHLITLSDDQVALGDKNPLVCKNYLLYEGCSYEESYINQFYQRFWPDLLREWQLIEDAQNGGEYYAMLNNFYRRHTSEFVSSYAATNPTEDIAESWTAFILDPKPEGERIADEKVLFFHDFPELVEYRSQIISGLCSYVK